MDSPDSYDPVLLALLGHTLKFVTVTGILLLLLAMSAGISASETAFFSLEIKDIQSCRLSQRAGDKCVIRLLKRPQRLLATILIVNNLMNVAFVTLSTAMAWQMVGTKSLEAGVITALTALTSLSLVFFGEVIPKTYASQYPLSYARAASQILFWLDRLLIPMTKPFVSLNKWMERRMERKNYSYTSSSLKHVLNVTLEGAKTEEQKDMLENIINLSDTSVKEIMTSRMDIVGVEKQTNFHELLNIIGDNNCSRLPVYAETLDKIEGVLYTKDLLPHLEKKADFVWQQFLKPAYFVSEHKKVDALFRDFQSKRVHHRHHRRRVWRHSWIGHHGRCHRGNRRRNQ